MSMMNPLAGPSGPGEFSTRTDQLSLGSAFYSDDTAALNTAAPKSKTRGSADNVGGRPASAITNKTLTPMYAETQQTNVPSTYGVDTGDGAGSEVLMMNQPDDSSFKTSIASYMPVLTYISNLPNTSPETKKAIRELKDQL
jgi:hypothetical protein